MKEEKRLWKTERKKKREIIKHGVASFSDNLFIDT